MITKEQVAIRLREAKARAGLSFGQIELRCGVRGTTAYMAMNGLHEPRASTLAELCRVLDVSADWVLGLSDDLGEESFNQQMEKTCREALAVFGPEHQVQILFEEMAELQLAICRHRRGRDTADHIAEEIADVKIMLEQMEQLFKCRVAVGDMQQAKLDRLREMINETAKV